jgi:GxxExxY protein
MEQTVSRVIGCCLAVHRALGPGLLESVYTRATAIELERQEISFECQKPVAIRYRDRLVCHKHRPRHRRRGRR